jgi:hypothetical protein
MLAMPGFARAAIGHNPLAFGCPMPDSAPIVFDIACSVAARGHILLAAREGRPIPEGWALDEEGAPTTDTQRALRGMLRPLLVSIGVRDGVECLAGARRDGIVARRPQRNPGRRHGGQQGAFPGRAAGGMSIRRCRRYDGMDQHVSEAERQAGFRRAKANDRRGNMAHQAVRSSRNQASARVPRSVSIMNDIVSEHVSLDGKCAGKRPRRS